MALLNYSAPYLSVTPHVPPAPSLYQSPIPQPHQHQHQHQQKQQQSGPYSYPHPAKPFNVEEYPHRHEYHQPAVHNPAHLGSDKLTPPTFTRVNDDETHTSVHAVIDYDDYEDDEGDGRVPVTPIQGPIFMKNGTVPVVPLFSHPVLNNGSFVQIPLLWTALSTALGLEIKGEYIRGVPCIKRKLQLYCPTAGSTYPIDRIEHFIDENKALVKRMFGEFEMMDFGDKVGPYPDRVYPDRGGGYERIKRSANIPGVPDLHFDPEEEPEMDMKMRKPRQAGIKVNQSSESGRIDSCESKIEIITPFWASNSAGKIRAIVNTQHFEQAIHQEVCTKSSTKRCSGDCGCEQKYKWHRLLAYDPADDCKGIFMDWFLYPSCCVCRCNPS